MTGTPVSPLFSDLDQSAQFLETLNQLKGLCVVKRILLFFWLITCSFHFISIIPML